MAEDNFSQYCRAYLIPNKEAMAKVLMDQHFDVYGLPDQLHSDNGKEFVNNLWVKLLTISLYNPSSNPVERFHRTITTMAWTWGLEYKLIGTCGLMCQCLHIILQ